MFLPQWRGDLEQFLAEVRDVEEEPGTHSASASLLRRSGGFLAELDAEGTLARSRGWQREYLRGVTGEDRFAEHQTELGSPPLSDVAARDGEEPSRD